MIHSDVCLYFSALFLSATMICRSGRKKPLRGPLKLGNSHTAKKTHPKKMTLTLHIHTQEIRGQFPVFSFCSSVDACILKRKWFIGLAFCFLHLTCDKDSNSLPIFSARLSYAAWDSCGLRFSTGSSCASHPLKPPSITTTLWVGGQIFLKWFATMGALWALYWQKKPTIDAIGLP